MTRIKMNILNVKLPFYSPCKVECGLQNGVSTSWEQKTRIDFDNHKKQNWKNDYAAKREIRFEKTSKTMQYDIQIDKLLPYV